MMAKPSSRRSPLPYVDEQESRRRVQELGEKLRGLWPKDKGQFQTSTETAMKVDAFYRAGLPNSNVPVKLLLLSESPCFTRDDLAEMIVDRKALKDAGIEEFDGPETHVNLVHCLTYGEAWALKEDSIKDSTTDKKRQYSTGTHQFWKVLATMAGLVDVREDGYDPLLNDDTIKIAYGAVVGGGSSDEKNRNARLFNKHAVLQKLRELGIVLVDISPFAIFMGGGTVIRTNQKTGNKYYTPENKLDGKTYSRIIKAAFETYSLPFLQDVKPEKVLLLGLTLEDTLGKEFLQNEVESFGGTLLETMIHPSANTFLGKNTISSLQTVRNHAIAARGVLRAAEQVEVKIVNPPKKSRALSAKRKKEEKPNVSPKENVAPISMPQPPKKKGKRQSRNSQKTELMSMHNTGKWPDFCDWK